MREILLAQGTPDWLSWRKGEEYVDDCGHKQVGLNGPRITATAASVCGVTDRRNGATDVRRNGATNR